MPCHWPVFFLRLTRLPCASRFQTLLVASALPRGPPSATCTYPVALALSSPNANDASRSPDADTPSRTPASSRAHIFTTASPPGLARTVMLPGTDMLSARGFEPGPPPLRGSSIASSSSSVSLGGSAAEAESGSAEAAASAEAAPPGAAAAGSASAAAAATTAMAARSSRERFIDWRFFRVWQKEFDRNSTALGTPPIYVCR